MVEGFPKIKFWGSFYFKLLVVKENFVILSASIVRIKQLDRIMLDNTRVYCVSIVEMEK